MDDRMVLLNPRYDKNKDKKSKDLKSSKDAVDSEEAGAYSDEEGPKQHARDQK